MGIQENKQIFIEKFIGSCQDEIDDQYSHDNPKQIHRQYRRNNKLE